MHLFKLAFYLSGAFYALFIEQALLIPFFAVVLIYFLISTFFLKGSKDISIRKKLMLATWTNPSEGVITVRTPVRTEKVNQIIHSQKDKHLTLTHFAIKAVGQLLVTQPELNGKLVFGKWVPYETVDVSCLIDIQGGKDLAYICLRGVEKMSVEDIASFIRSKATKMKKNSGGEEHKKSTKPMKFIPAFLTVFLVDIVNFITCKLGISVPAVALQKHAFGAACVTSLGMLGFEDAVAPFTDFANCSMFVSVNGAIKAPVVEGDKVVVGDVMNCNFVVDHRYVDGGKCTKLVPAFRRVFEHPEEFMDSHMKKQ